MLKVICTATQEKPLSRYELYGDNWTRGEGVRKTLAIGVYDCTASSRVREKLIDSLIINHPIDIRTVWGLWICILVPDPEKWR